MEKFREQLRRRRIARDEIGRLVAEWQNASHCLFTAIRDWTGDISSEGLLSISLDREPDGFTKLSLSETGGQRAVMDCRSYGTVVLYLEPFKEGDLFFNFIWRSTPNEWRIAVLTDIEDAIVSDLTPQEQQKALERLHSETYEYPDDPLDFVADRERARRSFAKRKMTQEEIYRRAELLSPSVLEQAFMRLWGNRS